VSFSIRRGETVALVGLSGGGKSTITNLLLRFHEPTTGRVTLDDVDIRAYRQKAWRARIGLVQQDIHLFPGTVADNLRALVDDIGQDALERAANTVGADQVIARLPLGYEEPLTEGGANLSMGERQLLSFARALVNNPDLLILDEATSSVDPGTERRLQESMNRMLSGRTALVIAHRLVTVVAADRILVVHGGRVVETGAHDELYARGGVYRDLFDLQFRRAASA
jgi:ATP-binding cassette subfamily B protein